MPSLHVPFAVAAILPSMAITNRDLQAAEARRRDLLAIAPAASVIQEHHRRIAQQMAEAAGSQITATMLAPKLREFSRQAELLAEQLGGPVPPVDGDLHGSDALTRTTNVDWLLLSQLTIRATILAFFLARGRGLGGAGRHCSGASIA